MEEEKIIVVENEVNFFKKYLKEARSHLLFYDRQRNGEPEFCFFGNDCTIYKCKGYKAKAYFDLMGNMRVRKESITYEVAD